MKQDKEKIMLSELLANIDRKEYLLFELYRIYSTIERRYGSRYLTESDKRIFESIKANKKDYDFYGDK